MGAEVAGPRAAGHRGWTILVVVAGVLAGLSAVSTFAALLVAAARHELGGTAGIAARGLAGVVFWVWIGLGASRRRAPVEGTPAPIRTGWTPVVSALNVGLLLVAAFALAGGLWLAIDDARRHRTADDLREQVELVAKRTDLTRVEVVRARDRHVTWVATSGAAEGRPDPYASLLPGVDAEVLDVAVAPDQVAVLVGPTDRTPPCVVLAIDDLDLVTTRVTGSCS